MTKLTKLKNNKKAIILTKMKRRIFQWTFFNFDYIIFLFWLTFLKKFSFLIISLFLFLRTHWAEKRATFSKNRTSFIIWMAWFILTSSFLWFIMLHVLFIFLNIRIVNVESNSSWKNIKFPSNRSRMIFSWGKLIFIWWCTLLCFNIRWLFFLNHLYWI